MIKSEMVAADTAVIIVSFGDDPARVKANTLGIEKQLQQDLYCDVYLVELLCESGKSVYPQALLQRVKHLTIPFNPKHGGLFHKESLMNYGWRQALKRSDYQYFIFVDADTYAEDLSWFRQIRDRLQTNPSAAVQGFRTLKDTQDTNIQYSSVAAPYVLNYQSDLALNPGVCWGLSADLLQAGDGFNAYFLDGAGDSAFVTEYLNWQHFQYDTQLEVYRWFWEAYRDLPFRAQLEGVPVDVIHIYHGSLETRNYWPVRYAIDGFPSVKTLVSRDKYGLLIWRDENCVERRILQRKEQMLSNSAVDRLFESFQYKRSDRSLDHSQQRCDDKSIFLGAEDPTAQQPNLNSSWSIFDPVKILGSHFCASWSEGVKNTDKNAFLPVALSEEIFILSIETDPSYPDSVWCLPIQPSWAAFDITGYATLSFRLRGSDSTYPTNSQIGSQTSREISVQLECKDDSDIIQCSDKIVLGDLDSVLFKEYAIPLSQFCQQKSFSLRDVRAVVFKASNQIKVELANVRMEPLKLQSYQIPLSQFF